jgi:hypothetical protein
VDENKIEQAVTQLPEELQFGIYHAMLCAGRSWTTGLRELSDSEVAHVRKCFEILHGKFYKPEEAINGSVSKSDEKNQQP